MQKTINQYLNIVQVLILNLCFKTSGFYQKGSAASSLKIWPVVMAEVVILKFVC